jgi:hypothetical protein
MEDEVPVSMREMEKLCGGASSQDELRQLECEILTTIGFDVEAVTVAEFLGNFLAVWRLAHDLMIGKGAQLNKGTCTECDVDFLVRAAWSYAAKTSDEDRRRWNGTWYLAALSLLDTELLNRCKPSEIAAASLLLSNRHLRLEDPWGTAITNVTGYTESSLEPCVVALERLRVTQMSATCRPAPQTTV